MEVGYSIEDNQKNVKYCKTLTGIDYIGDYYVLFNIQSNYFFKALTEVKAFAINKSKLIKNLNKFPALFTKLKKKAFNRYFECFQRPIEKQFNIDIKIFNSIHRNIQINKYKFNDVIYFLM